MEMNDMEKAAKIAEMMGWEKVDTIHIINKDGQSTWHWAKDGKYVESRFYDPANNVAQAIDAAEYYRKQHLEQNCCWGLTSPDGGYFDFWGCAFYFGMDPDTGAPTSVFDAEADTPAAAIVDALLTAMEEEA